MMMGGNLAEAESNTTIWDTVAEYPEPPEDLLADIRESIQRVETLAAQISFIGEDVAPLAEEVRRGLAGA